MPVSPPTTPTPQRFRLHPLVLAVLALPGIGHAQLSGRAAAPAALDNGWGFMLTPQIVERPMGDASPSVFAIGRSAAGTADKDMTVDGDRPVTTDAADPSSGASAGSSAASSAESSALSPAGSSATAASPRATTPSAGADGSDARESAKAQADAELRRYGSVVKADRLHYDEDTDLADAYGHVRLNDHGNRFVGPRAQLRLGASEGYMLSPTYHFSNGGGGQAERIDIIDNERTRFTKGTYSACNCADPAWYMKASSFEMDQGDNSGVARNGVLYFQGVPIFASPYLSFPLNNDRQSGLLPPTVSVSTTTGFDFTLPYYFNLAPNYDLTLRPRIMQRRGVQLGADYRYLSERYSGNTTIEYMPDDRAAGRSNRYAIFTQHQQDLGNGFGAYVNYNRVSDSSYTTDLSTSNAVLQTGTQLLYQQEAGITYSNGPWSVLSRVQRWQALSGTTPPYSREPELDVNYRRYDVGGFDFGAEANYTYFRSQESGMPEGQRVFLNPYVSYPIIRAGYFIVPKLQWHLASYRLTLPGTTAASQPNNTTSPNLSVSVPTASLDAGLIFERRVQLFGSDFIQTLEPRVFYAYTPYVDQSLVPVFDTAQADFGAAEIFTENTYVGNDRIADGERVTVGLTSRFINPASGDERARFTLAQKYYIRGQRVTLPQEALAGSSRSDVLVGASLKLFDTFATQNAVQYNPDGQQLVRANFGVAWSPADRRVVNLAYRYSRVSTLEADSGRIKQAVLSAQWPLTRQLYGVGRVNYALDAKRLVDGVLGFQYDAQCWTFGVALQRYANGVLANGLPASGTRVLAQLELKGFTKIDNGLVSAFQAGVPGYVQPSTTPLPLSRFSNYE
ncbi:LPS-assembly protein LptD [Chitinasiproducens palmae]|uniref:LPS-assembly protein LptD n=1 Tax=Chitinasiproducens palmae TaxID=1770053 RepID=A0A1H2PN60_9BURK|nr:LPS-assembly protein LptD [Chitinasiproducens palmae]SDV48114.1 LPS-assembly protein [Chitinasiproducens palmae]